MKRFRKGAMRFAVGLDIPIVPAVISGTEDAWPRKTRFMKPVPITIEIFPPIYPEQFSDSEKRDYNKYLSTQTKIMEEMISERYAQLRASNGDNVSVD